MSSPRASIRARTLIRATIALLLVWTVAAAGVQLARSKRLTAAGVIAFLRQHDVASLPTDSRALVLREAASRLNRLGLDDMKAVRDSRALFTFYRPLHPLEKERFAALVIPTGLRRILDASRTVPLAQRPQYLERALFLATVDFTAADPPIDPQALERIEKDALRNYIHDLSNSERLEMEPQLQQIHGYLYPSE